MKTTPIEVKKLIDTEEISACFESFLEDATEDNAVYLAQKIIETYLEKNHDSLRRCSNESWVEASWSSN